ncbi:coiled-coil domain-containing protein, partial [Cumulibacter manganitolerans]|uniref:hypothetical protein n=1 Tax=Cumulibacter manganitolerans TaxID=1884992 RepID=UPI0012969AC6
MLSPVAANADPAADKAGVQAQIVQTQHDLEVISEQYNDAKIALDQLTAQAAAAQAAAAQAATSLGDEQQKVAQTGASLYKGPTLAEAQTLIAGSSPQEIIDKLSTLDQISEHYGEAVHALQSGQSAAAAAQADAQQKASAAAATAQDLAAKKAEIEAKLPGLQTQLASLTDAERQAVLAQAGGHATGQPEAVAATQPA